MGDDPQAVQANRQRLQAALRGVRPVFLQQVHGTQVVDLHPRPADGAVADAESTTWPGLHHHGGRLPAAAADQPAGHGGGCGPRGLAWAGGRGAGGCDRDGFQDFFGSNAFASSASSYTINSVRRRRSDTGLAGPIHRPAGFEVGPEVWMPFVRRCCCSAVFQ